MKKEQRSENYNNAFNMKTILETQAHISGSQRKSAKSVRDSRGVLLETMQGILEVAKEENRDLTSVEVLEFAEIEKLEETLTRHITLLEKEERESGERAFARGNGQSNYGPDSEWRDVKTGANIAVLTKEQRMSDRYESEFKNISLGKTLRALVTGNWSDAQEEHRALSTSISSAGVIVPAVLASGIMDLARAKSVLINAGVRTVAMPYGNMTIAKVTQDPSMEYKAENIAFAEQEVGFGPVNLKAHTLGTIVTISRELAMDSSNAASAITTALAGALAAEIDRVGLVGTGIDQPRGILNGTGVQEITALGAFANYADFIQAWVKVQEANGAANGYIVTPRDAGALESLMTTGGDYMKPPGSIDNLPRYISNNLPKNLGAGANESIAFLGDFSTMLFGITEGMLIETTTTGGGAFEKHQVKFKVTWRGDVGFERPNWMVRLLGITA